MQSRTLGPLGPVSALTEAIDGRLTLIDLAPRYGDGEAERVIGEAERVIGEAFRGVRAGSSAST